MQMAERMCDHCNSNFQRDDIHSMCMLSPGCMHQCCIALNEHGGKSSCSHIHGSIVGCAAGLTASDATSDIVTGKRKRRQIDYKVCDRAVLLVSGSGEV